MDNLTNVVNDILFDEIKQDQGVFKDVNIDTDGNILVGEKFLINNINTFSITFLENNIIIFMELT